MRYEVYADQNVHAFLTMVLERHWLERHWLERHWHWTSLGAWSNRAYDIITPLTPIHINDVDEIIESWPSWVRAGRRGGRLGPELASAGPPWT